MCGPRVTAFECISVPVCVVLLGLGQWVDVWRLHENEIYSAADFLLLMISPILFYSAAQLLVSSRPESVESWQSAPSSG